MESETLQDKPLSTLNSGTISKYATEIPEGEVKNAALPDHHEEAVWQRPMYFNYHEFLESYYADIGLPNELVEHSEENSLCITHFPNVYVSKNSKEFETTRIVRVPRRFESTVDYPCFSTSLPGLEPAALVNDLDGKNFVPHGIYDNGQLFGYSSVSPLSQFLTQEEFENLVNPINDLMRRACRSFSWLNILEYVLEIVTLGAYHLLCKYIFHNPLFKVEEHILYINETPTLKKNGIKIISPRRSGYLSVCTQVFSTTLLSPF